MAGIAGSCLILMYLDLITILKCDIWGVIVEILSKLMKCSCFFIYFVNDTVQVENLERVDI